MIKNIIFDIDGVLVNLDRSYHNFLTTTYPEHKDMKYEEMVVHFPIKEDDGAFELPKEFGLDFINSPYYVNRPFFKSTLSVLEKLKAKGLTLITLTAASAPEKKIAWLKETFGDTFNAYEASTAGVPKDEGINSVVKKYNLNKDETLFIDDRIYNVRAGVRTGVNVVRMEPDFFLPLPKDLDHVTSISDLEEILELIEKL